MAQRRGLSIRILIALMLFMAMVWTKPIDYTGEFAGIDLAQYRVMAQASPSLASNIPAPFAYRILPPYLVGLVAAHDDAFGFRVFTVMCMVLMVVLLFRLLRLYGADEATALLLCAVACCNPYFVGMTLFNTFQACDALALVFMLVMFHAIKSRHLTTFGLALFFGSMTRETTLLLIPVALLSTSVGWQSTLRWRLVLACLPAVALTIFIRFSVPVSNPEWSVLSTAIDYAPSLLDVEVWGRILLNTVIPLSFIPLIFLRESRSFITHNRELIVFVLLVLCTSLIGADRERLFSPAFIVVLIYCVQVWRRHRSLIETPFVIALLLASVLCSLHFITAMYGIANKLIYYGLCIAASAAIALLASRVTRNDPSSLRADESDEGSERDKAMQDSDSSTHSLTAL